MGLGFEKPDVYHPALNDVVLDFEREDSASHVAGPFDPDPDTDTDFDFGYYINDDPFIPF